MARSETPTLVACGYNLLMTQEWYINVGGRVEGPVPADELHDRAATGRLAPTDRVSTDGVEWMPASAVPGLPFPTPRQRHLVETVVSGSVRPDATPVASDTSVVPVVSVAGYSLLDTLGAGACGVVYKARHQTLNRVVALKTILMPDKASHDLIERFKQEAVSLARLQHPNIVVVYDSGFCETPKSQVYFAMELLDGEDLDQRIERTGPLDERTAWLIARQTAAALAHAAKLGVIHRDIKPANLFLVPPPTGFPLPPDVPMVKVTDFGLALTHGGTEHDQRQTAPGLMLGTPVYMAPEQFTGSTVDPRADIYSLGATVYHMLAGHPPFEGRTVWEVMKKKTWPAPRLAPPISAATADLVAAMMAAEADDRPADYAELIARIDALPCLEGAFSVTGMPSASGRMPAASAPVIPLPPVPPTPPPPAPAAPPLPASRRGRWVYGVAAVALVGLGVGIAALAGAFHRTPGKTPGPDEPGAKHVHYTVASHELLYKSGSLAGWVPAGGSWEIVQDEEKSPVLSGSGGAVRPFHAPANFRVILTLDPHKATTVDVTIATASGPSPTRWLVRLDRQAGAVFGKRVGSGAFQPMGNAVPLPTPEELTALHKRPYLEVRYERAGGTLTAWFQSEKLGSIPDSGLTTDEFRVQATGGPIRIDYADLETLIEQR